MDINEERMVQCLEIVGEAYETADFSTLLENISDDCRWDSQWVIEPRIGKQVLTEYYTSKGRAMQEGISIVTTRIIRFTGGLGHVRPNQLFINGEKCPPNSACGIYVPPGTLALLSLQTLEDGSIWVAIKIGLDESGKISKIDLNDPDMYGPYEKYRA